MRRRRWVLAGLGLIVTVLVGDLLLNALLIRSEQGLPRDKPIPSDPADAEKARRRLGKAVTFRTVSDDPNSGPEFARLKEFLKQEFPRLHSDPRVVVDHVSDASLLYTWMGDDPSLPGVLLTAHLDVVPAPNVPSGTSAEGARAWEHDPFSGERVGDVIWGRGTLDDKVSVMAILEAAEGLLRHGVRPARTLYFGFGQDEEVGGRKGAIPIARLLKSKLGGKKLECVVDEGTAIVSDMIPGLEPPIAAIGLVEKGYVNIILTARGPGGHSSMAPEHSAIGILCRAVGRVEGNPFRTELPDITRETLAALAPEMGIGARLVLANLWLFGPVVRSYFATSPALNAMVRTTGAVTVIRGGEKDNVLPETATAIVNFRLLPGTTPEQVREHVRRVVADPERVRVEIDPDNSYSPSHQSSARTASYGMLRQVIRDVFQEGGTGAGGKQVTAPVVVPFLVTAGTDARFYEEVSDNVYRFLPIRLRPDELGRIHGVNEQIRVKDYDAAVVFYRELMINAMRSDLGAERGGDAPRGPAPGRSDVAAMRR